MARRSTTKKTAKIRDAAAMVSWSAENCSLFNREPAPFHAVIDRQDPKLVVITGENASGKSLFFQFVAAMVREEDGALPLTISIRERISATNGMRRVFMFGDETEQSTGATSINTLVNAFTRNLDHEDGSMLMLDEPELGLSDGYARAMGEYIGQSTHDIPAVCGGVIVITHSRTLVGGLLDGYGATPTHVSISADAPQPAGIQQWLESSEERTVEQLLALRDVGLDRWRQVLKILKR